MMDKALIAFDPNSCTESDFDGFTEAIRLFQQNGLLPHTNIASVYDASATTLPYEFYNDLKEDLINEAYKTIRSQSQGKFDFESVKILDSNSASDEDHVELLSVYAKRIGANLIVLGSNDRTGFPYWLLGSFTEIAASRASVPVLIVKPKTRDLKFSQVPTFVVAIDAAIPPAQREIQWIAEFAQSAHATLELLYVVPQYRPVIDGFQQRISEDEAKLRLEKIQTEFRKYGVSNHLHLREEATSVAHTVVELAEEVSAWVTITTAVKRPKSYQILSRSRALQILSLGLRPFLSVRLDENRDSHS